MQHDSGSSKDRPLIFSTKKNLESMVKFNNWFIGVTFKCSPKEHVIQHNGDLLTH